MGQQCVKDDMQCHVRGNEAKTRLCGSELSIARQGTYHQSETQPRPLHAISCPPPSDVAIGNITTPRLHGFKRTGRRVNPAGFVSVVVPAPTTELYCLLAADCTAAHNPFEITAMPLGIAPCSPMTFRMSAAQMEEDASRFNDRLSGSALSISSQ